MILHLVRAGAAPPDELVAEGDRVVLLDEAATENAARELLGAILEAHGVITW